MCKGQVHSRYFTEGIRVQSQAALGLNTGSITYQLWNRGQII